VLFVTAYHKGYEFTERTKIIQRYLPREIGELLVYYLWLALPFSEAMQVVVGGVDELSAFVWGDGQTDRVEGKGGDELTDRAGGDETTGRAGRGELTDRARRPRKRWTSERMRKAMQTESVAWAGTSLNISAWRQISIAIARRLRKEKDGSEGHEGLYEDDVEEEDSPWDLQAGHGTRLAGMLYARLLSEGKFETRSQKERFRRVSMEWHRFLGFTSSWEGALVAGQKRKRAHWEEVGQEMQMQRWRQMRAVNTQARLEALLGAGSRFRGEQEGAISAVMRGQSPVVVVMGTGGGKSMVFMLPASSVVGGTTIVIVPLVSLQGNLQERCTKARISSIVWSSSRPHDTASIIFVTPESAMTKAFAGLMNRLEEMSQLDRIVVDECHTVLDGSPGFRPKLRQLGQLASSAQMVYLTATLPPREEGEFYELLGIEAKAVAMFRGRTSRANVRYEVRTVDGGEGGSRGRGHSHGSSSASAVQMQVLQLVEEKLEQYPAPGKIMIYSSRVEEVEELGEVLGCEVYHRTVDSRDGKARRLKEWMEGKARGGVGEGRVMVATNALGLGIDVPDIRMVMHVGRVHRLKDYGQESGRAGRDGQRSEAIIVMPAPAPAQATALAAAAAAAQLLGPIDIAEFIEGKVCRRVVLDEVMDGRVDRVGCEEGEEACDICEGEQMGVEGADDGESELERQQELGEFETQRQERQWGQQQVVTRRREEGVAVKELREQLEEWVGGCPLCRLHLRLMATHGQGQEQGRQQQGHQLEQCPRPEAKDILQEVEAFIEGVKYERFSSCYYCGVPQAICERWVQKEEQGWWDKVVDGSCQYKGVLIRVVATLLAEGEDWVTNEMYEWIRGLGVEVEERGAVHKWLGERVEWGGIEATRMVQVFHKLVRANRR
jgi:superfamily II DNA helicase RecQ